MENIKQLADINLCLCVGLTTTLIITTTTTAAATTATGARAALKAKTTSVLSKVFIRRAGVDIN